MAPKSSTSKKSKPSKSKAKPVKASASKGSTSMAKKKATAGESPIDGLRKAFLIGLGATVTSAEIVRDKIEDLIGELSKGGTLTEKEAKKLGDELKEKALTRTHQMESSVKTMAEQYTRQAVHALGLVTREEFEALKASQEGKTPSKTASKPAAKKPAAKKSPAKKTAAKKPTAKKSATKKSTTAKKSTAKKAAPKKTTAKKSSASKTTAKKK